MGILCIICKPKTLTEISIKEGAIKQNESNQEISQRRDEKGIPTSFLCYFLRLLHKSVFVRLHCVIVCAKHAETKLEMGG